MGEKKMKLLRIDLFLKFRDRFSSPILCFKLNNNTKTNILCFQWQDFASFQNVRNYLKTLFWLLQRSPKGINFHFKLRRICKILNVKRRMCENHLKQRLTKLETCVYTSLYHYSVHSDILKIS